MVWKYMGEMTFKKAVDKYSKKLPDLPELKEIPVKVLKQSKDHDAWGIVLDKQGKICGPVARWLVDCIFHDCIYLCFNPDFVRGVFIKVKKRR